MRTLLILLRTLLVSLLLIGIGVAGVAAYHGVFYVTGSQFYEGCWYKMAREKEIPSFKEPRAGNPSQAVIWASCFPIVVDVILTTGFALGSSAPKASAEEKALLGSCPDRYTEVPLLTDRIWMVVIETIERTGGPSPIDYLAPAGWLVERSLKARWPRCIDAARPYIGAIRKSGH